MLHGKEIDIKIGEIKTNKQQLSKLHATIMVCRFFFSHQIFV